MGSIFLIQLSNSQPHPNYLLTSRWRSSCLPGIAIISLKQNESSWNHEEKWTFLEHYLLVSVVIFFASTFKDLFADAFEKQMGITQGIWRRQIPWVNWFAFFQRTLVSENRTELFMLIFKF